MICCAVVKRGTPTFTRPETRSFLVTQVALLLFIALSSLGQNTPATASFAITGIVKSGNTAIPGATVIATNPVTGVQTATSSDINGNYSLQVVAQGKYQLRVEMPGFAASTREIVLSEPKPVVPTLS